MNADEAASCWSQKRAWSGDLDQICHRFEQAWQAGEEPLIESFLDSQAQEQSGSRELLIELVGIDLEWRWRRAATAPARAVELAATIDFPPGGGALPEPLPACPCLEDYVRQYPALGPCDALPVQLIAHEYWVRHRWGDRPRRDEYCHRFPRQWATLQDTLDRLEPEVASRDTVRDTGLPGTDSRPDQATALRIRCPHCDSPISLNGDEELVNLTCSSCGERFNLVGDGANRRGDSHGPQRIAHFELIEPLGAGAFGVVWKARDTQLDRIVALKIPRQSQLDRQQTEQFLREARAAAQLRHPHIVSVHEVGREADRIYIVSDFIEGQPLDRWLKQNQPTHRETAELCRTIAQGLHCAHERGVIHRDLKPGNIMLDRRGSPYIMDFGLAKREAAEVTVTQEGQILGTPAYMSPEQAKGEGHTVDARTDVYSLGVILFELLTAVLPFRAKSIRMLLKQVIEDEPPAPRKFDSRIPRDLETICLKCLEKEPARRYPSSQDLADELVRFLEGRPIEARPIGKLTRSWRWCRRNPVVAVLSATAVALLLVVALVATVGNIRTGRALSEARFQEERAVESLKGEQRERKRAQSLQKQAEQARAKEAASREQAEAARQKEEQARRAAEANLYFANFALAGERLRQNSFAEVERILEACPEDYRHWEWGYLKRLCHLDALTISGQGQVSDLAFSPDGKQIAVASHFAGLRVFDATTGSQVWGRGGGGFAGGASFHAGTQIVPVSKRVGYCLDGREIVYCQYDQPIKVLGAQTGEEIRSIGANQKGF